MNSESESRDPASARQILTVAELNRAVAGLLERNFPLIWVRGEISNLTRAASGHWYFSLKDREAQVRCVMFRNRNQAVDWSLREGDQVEARVLVSLYAPRGDYQLNVEQLRRAGAGSLFEAFLRLKQKLQEEGLFDPVRKRALPAFPRAIGIVTSPQAAALRDVLTTLRRRAPHVRIVIYPTAVQGTEAPAGIAQALALASCRAPLDGCEALLLVRGGGSIEDLWAFNDEGVARAVTACSIPVVSGVGHETDFTIADFAADLRAPTPTAAAELVSPDGQQLRLHVAQRTQSLRRSLERVLANRSQRTDDATRRLKSPMQRWREAQMRVENAAARLVRGRGAMIAGLQRGLNDAVLRLRRSAPDTLQRSRLLMALNERRLRGGKNAEQVSWARLALVAARLDLLSPQSALERGYAIATDATGAVVRDASMLRPGESLHVAFARGAVDAEVVRVHAVPDVPDSDRA